MARAAAINPAAWLLWLVGVAAVPIVTRNPFYLALDLLVVVVVYLALPRRSGAARAWRLFVTIGLTLAALSIGFNVLTVHVGDRVFARIPEVVPIVGGKLTWNALAYGTLSALALAALLIAAAAFNTAIRPGDLIRLLPNSYASLGIAGSIAMTMVPQTIAAGRDIFDAQRARGHRFRGLRDAPSLVVPLLGTGLERAMTLSEALETRGFGASASATATAQPTRRWPLLAASGCFLLSLALLGYGQLAGGLLALGAGVFAAFRAAPLRNQRTRFREMAWSTASVVVAGVGLLCPLTLALVPAITSASLAYDPFPTLVTPEFHPVAGVAIVLLAAPTLWSTT